MKIKFLNENEADRYIDECLCIHGTNFKGYPNIEARYHLYAIDIIGCILHSEKIGKGLECSQQQLAYEGLRTIGRKKRKRKSNFKSLYREAGLVLGFIINKGYAIEV